MTRSLPALLIGVALFAGAPLHAQHHSMDSMDPTEAATPAVVPAAQKAAPSKTAEAPPAPVNSDIQVRTWLSQTSMWVGDAVEFHVELTCAPNVDVLADDLSQDHVKLTGLEFVGSGEESPLPRPNGHVTRRFTYAVTSYEVSELNLQIGDFKIRYYVRRPGQRLEDTAPAGEITIPGAVLSMRSAIPDQVNTMQPRDQREAALVPALLPLARPVGIGMVVVSIVPVALSIVAIVRMRRPKAVRHSVRAARSHAKTAMEELRAVDTTTAAGRLEAYAKLETILRRHVAEATGVPAAALTSAEVETRLQAANGTVSATTVRQVLDQCEQARYRPIDQLPSRDTFESVLEETQQVISPGSR